MKMHAIHAFSNLLDYHMLSDHAAVQGTVKYMLRLQHELENI